MPFGYGRPLNMTPYVAAHCHPQPRWLPVKTLPGETYTHTRHTDTDMDMNCYAKSPQSSLGTYTTGNNAWLMLIA